MDNEKLREEFIKDYNSGDFGFSMPKHPDIIANYWLQKLSLREQELVQEIEKKAQGAEWVAKMMPNASVVLLSDIQKLLKSKIQ